MPQATPAESHDSAAVISFPAVLRKKVTGAFDIGQLEEFAARVRKATRFQHGGRLAVGGVKLPITAIGIGLQNP